MSTTASVRTTASASATVVEAPAGHVFATATGIDPHAARIAARIDPAFLAEAGWDRATRVLSLPAEHPLLGWRACQTRGCTNQVYGRDHVCGRCRIGDVAGPRCTQRGVRTFAVPLAGAPG